MINECFNLNSWKNDCEDHISALDTIINDRRILKKMMMDHLAQFFTWQKIEFSRNFDKITLSYSANTGAVIKPDIHANLGMDYIVSPEYDDRANRIIVIELYPFGLPEEGVLVED